MSTIFLIRHAQASFDAHDYDLLSPRGEIQAARLGVWMAARGARPGAIFTGTLRRHAQTAALCARAAGVGAPPVQVLPGLDELDGDELIARYRPELATREALLAALARATDCAASADGGRRAFQALFVGAVARWTSGEVDADYTTPWPAFRAAVLEAWATLLRDPADEAWVFTSGGPIGTLVAELTGADVARSFDFAWPLVNTSVSRIHVGRGGARLVTYNAWSHLDTAADAALVTHR